MTVGGDGGMTTTDNEETALKIKSIRDKAEKQRMNLINWDLQ